MLNNYRSIAFLTIISLTIIFIFFGELIIGSNHYYFHSYGDGIQSYHEYLYHIYHDETFIHSKSMQYPYGDNGYFSVNPLMLANTVKLIDVIIPIKRYSLAIFNLFVIFSLFIANIVIYKIFLELKVKEYYAVLFAILITFMSPQIVRFGGHNSLGYVFAIPIIFYLMISTWKNPKIWKSLLIGFTVFFLAGNHLYYLAFYLLIISSYYFLQFLLFYNDQKYSILVRTKHFILELILPLVITYILINKVHVVTDRTNYPWSFFEYLGSISGLYFPEYSFYKSLFKFFIDQDKIIWEAKSYIGLLPVIISLGLFLYLIKFVLNYNFRGALYFSRNSNIVILTIIGIFGLIIGLGFPFSTDWGKPLFFLSGPIKNFRAIARFNWIYYYAINIVAFYLFYQWIIRDNFKTIKLIVLISISVIYGFDIYNNNKNYNKIWANRIDILEDEKNLTEKNKPLNQIKLDKYQAIIGIPFFQQGTENLYMSFGQGMRNQMLYSIKTGLPTLDLHSNRTSISESFNTAQLILEPSINYKNLNRFPNKKSFLLIVDKYKKYSNYEEILIDNSKLIDSTSEVKFYELPFEYFNNAKNIYISKINEEFEQKKTLELTSKDITFRTYDNNFTELAYKSSGALVFPCDQYLTIFDDTLTNKNNLEYLFSFWVGNISTDVILRGIYILELRDKYGRLYEYRKLNIGTCVNLIDGNWALIEDKLTLNNTGDRIKLSLINTEIKGFENIVDNFLIRPSDKNVYFKNDNYFIYNNRFIEE